MHAEFHFDMADAKFVLFEQLKVADRLAEASADNGFSQASYVEVLTEAERVARDVLHPTNAVGDRVGCRLDSRGAVQTPPGYREAWQVLSDGGWVTPDAPASFGGAGLPHVVGMCVYDMFNTANTAMTMYSLITSGVARLIEAFFDGPSRELIVQRLYAGKWAGTMCLTEPAAGSSVGDCSMKATPVEGEHTYHLSGEKTFISGGDHDLTENIIHLVLARTPGSPVGTKGLSLFMVPKFLFNEGGVATERNGVDVARLEEKMGLHGSATCHLSFGAQRPAVAWRVGQEHHGIVHMFKIMNEARIAVACEGAATAGAAYSMARRYARQRVQGSLPGGRASGPQYVAIVQHPDVRRMLMTLKVVSETMRAACARLCLEADLERQTSDDRERRAARERADLLIPVLKAHCADLGFEMATTALQVFGGYGYIREYGIDQLIRDSKVQSVYEGTNGIQSIDLVVRKLRQQDGSSFRTWLETTRAKLTEAARCGLEERAKAFAPVVDRLQTAAQQLLSALADRPSGALASAMAFLKAFGVLVLGLESLDQAQVARGLMEVGRDSALLRGKLSNLDFYVAHLLPLAIAHCDAAQSCDDSCMAKDLFEED